MLHLDMGLKGMAAAMGVTAQLRRATAPRQMPMGRQGQSTGRPLPGPSRLLPGQLVRMQAMGRALQEGTARDMTQGMGSPQQARSAALMPMEALRDRCSTPHLFCMRIICSTCSVC